MKAEACNPISVPSKLAMHKDSRVISKPKIRIIHVFAPKIIKTDAANFRELVQKLTGKPADRRGLRSYHSTEPSKMKDVQDGVPILRNGERMMKECKEIYGGKKSNSYLGGFGDIDGLFQDLNEFSSLPYKSSLINVFGEIPLC